MPDQEPSPGQYFHDRRYRLERKIGQGGMGSVWLALDERLDEPVALKFLPAEIQHDPTSLDDMRRETARSRRLAHPNIVRIHDMHEYPGEVPFISMEFVDGVSLSGLKSQQPKRCFPWDFLKTVIEQLCSALEYAHSERVVHRDLKPSNVMFDDRGRVKLADFGIAAVATDSMSRVSLQGNTSGTPAYMSPQQMDGRTPRVTDDIYSLGALIYELFTGKPPFFRGDIPHQVRNIEPPTIEERLDEFGLKNPIPADVSAMIMACLSKDPGNRPQSARAVAEWIGFDTDQATTGGVLSQQIFGTEPAIEASPSSNELTVLPPDEPTEYKADGNAPPLPAADSNPRLTNGASLPYANAEGSETKTAPPKRSWKLLGFTAVALILLMILAGIANQKKKRSGRSGSLNQTSEIDAGASNANQPLLVTGPWRDAEPTEFRSGRPAMFRPFTPDSLENCTVIVLEEIPGKPRIHRSVKPWRSENKFWRIADGIITVSLRRKAAGAIKTYLVFNGHDLDTFFLSFSYRVVNSRFDEGNFGLFYRCRNLEDWYFDGLGIVLGDNSGKLWGVPEESYSVEEKEIGPGMLPRGLRDFFSMAGQSRLLEGDGHICAIRLETGSTTHVIDKRHAREYRFESTAGIPDSGTIALEAWIRGNGQLEVSFEGLFIRPGLMGPKGLRPKF